MYAIKHTRLKTFNVPPAYRSPLISAVKAKRKKDDRMKKDFSPTLLDLGSLKIYLARHFGFCYGVENAIEISFRTIEENKGKRIFLLSEMIHNPQVNADLLAGGVQFLQDTYGKQLIPFDTLTHEDVVIIPAFGTTLEIEKKLTDLGIPTERYNTTCPFVEKVWNRGDQIAAKGYSIIIHGKPKHEETRATFSHASSKTPSVVVTNMQETEALAKYISGEKPAEEFYTEFAGRYSEGFDASIHFERIGVINQTTQLATDTQAIADYLKQVMIRHYQLNETNISERFADTRDTLCYATNDNQTAVSAMLDTPADVALVLGGYNSSNTTHLVELLEQKLPTYFINTEENLLSKTGILHYDFHNQQQLNTSPYLPEKSPLTIMVTSGASCPDAVVERVIRKISSFFNVENKIEELIEAFSE